MIRRWLIRLPFLALALVVGLWVGSYGGELKVYGRFREQIWSLSGLQGLGVFTKEPIFDPGTSIYFRFEHDVTVNSKGYEPTLGFYYGELYGWPDTLCVIFPLWLPTLLLLGLSWFVWRKTRPKYNGRGFPVEPLKPFQSPAKSQ